MDTRRLRELGRGSGRAVYELNKDTVIKKAINHRYRYSFGNTKGILQNKAEAEISEIMAGEWYEKYFAKVIDISDDGIYLTMQKAKKTVSIALIRDILVDDFKDNHPILSTDVAKRILNYKSLDVRRDIFKDFLRDIERTLKLTYDDLVLPSAWGFINGEPKIIDYGFTYEVRKIYYGG